MTRLNFEFEEGAMIVYEREIHLVYYNNMDASKKYALYALDGYEELDRKTFYDCLKIVNLRGHLLTEEALIKFDEIVKKYELEEEDEYE